MSVDAISIVLSIAAFLLSGATAWYTLVRRGTVRVTRPSLIFFGPDGSRGPTKVFLRLFLYATADRGRIVEHMFVRLVGRDGAQAFTRWILRDETLTRGTGLSVDRQGNAADHHFVLAERDAAFPFREGSYRVEVWAQLLGDKGALLLTSQDVHLAEEQARAIGGVDTGIFFDWNPEAQQYESHLDRNRTAELNAALKTHVRLPRQGE